MVIRDGGLGLRPSGPDCFISEDAELMETEGGSNINGYARSYYTRCSRKTHKSEQCQQLKETNSRSILANGSSRSPRLKVAAQSMKLKPDAGSSQTSYGKVIAKEPAKANPGKRVKRLIATRSKKTHHNSSFCSTSSTKQRRLKYLAVSDENTEESSSICNSPQLQEDFLPDKTKHESDVLDNSLIPGLADDVVQMCLIRLSRSLYGSFYTVSKKFYDLFKSGELYKVRRDLGISEEWVYLLNSGQSAWRAFDPRDGGRWRTLPPTPADGCFFLCDKESLAAGTHLLVIGREIRGLVVWRYDLVLNSWSYAPQMITPRCLYASASSGIYGYVAGGVRVGSSCSEVTNCAERYNSLTESWEALPPMLKRRKLCSGFFMDGKFWVIGGLDENEKPLACGEHYDLKSRSWKLIPNMFPRSGVASFKAPPLVAVLESQLYALDVSVNTLKSYCQKSNTWRSLGDVPIREEQKDGWGLAFKALDGQLLLIGGFSPTDYSKVIYAWKPNYEGHLEWRFLTRLLPQGTFVYNCAVMSA